MSSALCSKLSQIEIMALCGPKASTALCGHIHDSQRHAKCKALTVPSFTKPARKEEAQVFSCDEKGTGKLFSCTGPVYVKET